MFIRSILIVFLIIGGGSNAFSQSFNEYKVWFGNEKKVGKKIVFDTVFTNIILTAPVSTKHTMALEIANLKASELKLKARIKYIRRLKSTEDLKTQITFK